MKSSPNSSTATKEFSIAQLATTPFRWGWYSSHYVPLMCPYHLQLLTQIRLTSNPKMIEIPTSLNTLRTSSNMSMTYWIEQMLSTNNIMISIGCHTSFKLVTKFRYICRRSISLGSTASFTCSDTSLKPSLRL